MNITDEDVQVLHLVQAMIGTVTRNLRRVTLEVFDGSKIILHFLLEQDDPIDRQEIDDIAFEFEALQNQSVELETEILVDQRPIEQIFQPGRIIFGRRESD